MAMMTRGSESTTPVQNRRVMDMSSGFSSSASDTVLGSSAIPQMGQLPGPSRTISGCMGQVHSVFDEGGDGAIVSSAMPHLGHAPGPSWRTSGCIGQVNISPDLCSSVLSADPDFTLI